MVFYSPSWTKMTQTDCWGFGTAGLMMCPDRIWNDNSWRIHLPTWDEQWLVWSTAGKRWRVNVLKGNLSCLTVHESGSTPGTCRGIGVHYNHLFGAYFPLLRYVLLNDFIVPRQLQVTFVRVLRCEMNRWKETWSIMKSLQACCILVLKGSDFRILGASLHFRFTDL